MSVLVTGGSGYIGAHLCIELLVAGYDIVLLDNFDNSKPETLKRIKEISKKEFQFYELDLLDLESLDRLFAENNIEAVVHLAGLKAVGESVNQPLRYYRNNSVGTLNLLETMQKYGVKKLVFSSSATVYGSPAHVPITEAAALQATNPYGRSKLIIEEILRDLYVSDEQWSIALLRYFNPVGAHSSGRLGEDPSGVPNNLMPYITQVATGKLEQLKVFGDQYPTRDGTGVRDYIHVVDLAIGHLKAMDKVLRGKGVEAYNLGTGIGYSVLEIIRTFEGVSGQRIPYIIAPSRAGDIAVCYADPSKAKQDLGWTAVRNIEQMCSDAWRWQKNNPTGYDEEISAAVQHGMR